MIHQINSFPEIKCPYCFSYISITQNKTNKFVLVLHCEKCGKKEMTIEHYYSLIQKNDTNICNYCCKNIPTLELFYSESHKNFLCKNCFSTLLNNKIISSDDFISISEFGNKCTKHKNAINTYFCESCEKHICEQCLLKHKNQFHEIKKICDGTKNKNYIEELKFMIAKEEKEIESEIKYGQLLLNSMSKIFENEIKNRGDVLYLKKMLFLYFLTNCDNYYTFLNLDKICSKENNPDFFINDTELNELKEIIKNIEINSGLNKIGINNNIKNNNPNKSQTNREKNNKNSYKNEKLSLNKDISKKRSITEIKQSKKNYRHLSQLSDLNSSKNSIDNSTDSKNNKNNNKKINNYKDMRKNLYALITPIKTQRMKNKKYYQKSNSIINKEIKNNNTNFLCSSMNVTTPQGNKNNENLGLIQKLNASVITMLFIDKNILLISVFAPDKNLILGELIREKKDNENMISMNIINKIKIGHKPIIYMEKCENENILSCSDEKVFIFKILNKKINIQNIFANNNIITCVPLEKENFLVLKTNIHDNLDAIIYYFFNNQNLTSGYKRFIKPIPKLFKAIYLEKISNETCALILKDMNFLNNKKSEIYFKLLKIKDNKLVFTFEKKFFCKAQEKISKMFFKKIFDNYLMIPESPFNFYIYDFLNDSIVDKFECENIISFNIKNINNEQIYVYTLENKEIDGKIIMEEIKIKKYLIKKEKMDDKNQLNITNKFEIILLSSSQLKGYNKNKKVNDMILIGDDREEKDKNGSDKNLVLLGDSMGNIFCKYY